jgi:hypothetical protein
MRCIFCQADSSASRSREHIIPESLGNEEHILPCGVVCDRCNNYFSREVEKPFLNSPGIELLRFNQGLESKKGRVPMIRGIIFPNIAVGLSRYGPSHDLSIDVPAEAAERVSKMEKGTLIYPTSLATPTELTISRFLAKVGMEALAARFCKNADGWDSICDEPQLDAIRRHARYGTTRVWPIHSRRIYDADAVTFGPSGIPEQVVHEFDFLVTKSNEIYFVLAIFGEEFTINMGGPAIDGFKRWLGENNGASPLYQSDKSDLYPRLALSD